ncbi:phosphatidylserine/phosphatidylglycerophosphate/cardiolipin synthase-like enzyme [Rhizobium sp. BK313]|nr:phosphatidylserine/phosphatidylglycerophosphate/cardiolipin synthase-like enzyme [Rhizobium sp. BK313]
MPSIAHNKVIVIDESLVIGGSYNYTAAAQRRNAENVTFIDGREVAREFLANWDSRLKASRAFEGPNSVSNKEAN